VLACALLTLARIPHLRTGMWLRLAFAALSTVLLIATASTEASPQSLSYLSIRGHAQQLHLYGPPRGTPIIVSSGDGGWMHLGPHVAELLAGRGFFVVGFDVKAYLTGFTTDAATLRTIDGPGDYKVLATFASAATGRKPILIGVSEGAGLSVLAASDANTKAAIAGVIGLGLPDRNELGWRWKDSLIYLTHRPPNEPAFSATALVPAVAPLPLALVQSTHDEFVPLAETQRIFAHASEPKRLWIVDATNHRFSSNLPEFDARLMEAIEWIQHNQPR
jgi:alpha-beta hydrolase superfamily lysophospholipase